MAEYGEPWNVIDIERNNPEAHSAGARGLGIKTVDGETVLLLWPRREAARAVLRDRLERLTLCVNVCADISNNDVRTRTASW